MYFEDDLKTVFECHRVAEWRPIMYVADFHCDSIQKADAGLWGVVNPYNFSSRFLQLQFVALFCGQPGKSPEQNYECAKSYADCFLKHAQDKGSPFIQAKNFADIERAFSCGKHAAILSIEGADGIKGDKNILRNFYDVGVRVMGLAWLSNQLAKSNRIEIGEEDTGLTERGKMIVEEGNKLGMIFDVSHLSDKSFWDLAELSEKPIIATHSNFRSICDNSRNLTDDMTLEIIKQKGIIGINLCPRFIHIEQERQTVDSLFCHIDHCLSLGGEDCLGFGFDIDGTGGKYPSPLDESTSIHDRVIESMLLHNYSETLVNKIAGGNCLEYLKNNL